MTLSPLGMSATNWPIVSAPCDRCWACSSQWNEHWQGTPKYSETTCPSATLCTTNPTWPDRGSNSCRRGGKPATNRLSYGTASEIWALLTTICMNITDLWAAKFFPLKMIHLNFPFRNLFPALGSKSTSCLLISPFPFPSSPYALCAIRRIPSPLLFCLEDRPQMKTRVCIKLQAGFEPAIRIVWAVQGQAEAVLARDSLLFFITV
jgi:hypothetical protein